MNNMEENTDILSNNLDFSKSLTLSWSHSSIEPWIKAAKEEIAKKYMQIHPKIKIDIIIRHPKNYEEWLKACLAAHSPPDIVTIDSKEYPIAFEPQNGGLIDLKPYLKTLNPYTGQIWGKEFSPQITTYDKYGYYLSIPYQSRFFKFIYNRKHFREIGQNEFPEDWDSFIALLNRLKLNGYIPFGIGTNDNNSILQSLSSLFMDQIYYSQLPMVDVFIKDGRVQKNEMVRAIDSGILKLDNPEIVKVLDLYKDFSIYWNSDFLSLNNSQVRDMFCNGKISIIMGSSWDIPIYTQYTDLEWDVLPFPILDKDNPLSSLKNTLEIDTTQDSHAVTKASESKNNADYAVDFLMSFSTYNAIIQQGKILGSKTEWKILYDQFIPTGKNLPYITPILFTFGDNEITNEIFLQTILLLDGQVNSKQFVDTLSKNTLNKVSIIKKENNWSSDNNYGQWFESK